MKNIQKKRFATKFELICSKYAANLLQIQIFCTLDPYQQLQSCSQDIPVKFGKLPCINSREIWVFAHFAHLRQKCCNLQQPRHFFKMYAIRLCSPRKTTPLTKVSETLPNLQPASQYWRFPTRLYGKTHTSLTKNGIFQLLISFTRSWAERLFAIDVVKKSE